MPLSWASSAMNRGSLFVALGCRALLHSREFCVSCFKSYFVSLANLTLDGETLTHFNDVRICSFIAVFFSPSRSNRSLLPLRLGDRSWSESCSSSYMLAYPFFLPPNFPPVAPGLAVEEDFSGSLSSIADIVF